MKKDKVISYRVTQHQKEVFEVYALLTNKSIGDFTVELVFEKLLPTKISEQNKLLEQLMEQKEKALKYVALDEEDADWFFEKAEKMQWLYDAIVSFKKRIEHDNKQILEGEKNE